MYKNELKKLSEALDPTTEQKERMFSAILAKSRSTEKRGITFAKHFKAGLAAAVIACFLLTTAFAATVFGLDAKFVSFLKPASDEQSEYLANGAYVVDKQASNKNGTLEVKQILGDENTVYILMDFTAPDGTVLDAERYRFDPIKSDYSTRLGEFYGSAFMKIEDDDPSDNKISLIMLIGSEHTMAGETMTLHLEDLYASYDQASNIPEAIAVPGEWNISFPLNFKNASRSFNINKPVALYGESFQMETASVSPLSISLTITGDFRTSIGDNKDFDIVFPVSLVFDDGSILTAACDTAQASAHASYTNNKLAITQRFHQVIDSDRVRAVIIFDQEFALQ